MCEKYFKRKHRIAKHIQIEHKPILVPDKKNIKTPDIFLQNPKVSKNVMVFNNHTQRSTPPDYLDVDNPFSHRSIKGSNTAVFCHVALLTILAGRTASWVLVVNINQKN